MILAVLGLFSSTLAILASENEYSRVMCEYLTLNGAGTNYCAADLVKRQNNYCAGDMFFFTESEIGKFINGSKMALDEMKADIEEEKKFLKSSTKEAKQACLGDKDCEKMVDVYIQIGIVGMDASYDITAGSYGMANTFNLGALCLGANPEGHFNDSRPIITSSILNRLEDLCNGSIDMVESYLYKIADAFGKINSEAGKAVRDMYKAMFETIRLQNPCPEIVRYIEFQESTNLAAELSEMMAEMFVIPGGLGEHSECILAHSGDIDNCNNSLDLESVMSEIRAAPMKMTVLNLGVDDGNFEVDDEDGFDVYGAAKKNPEYGEMTKEIPSKMGGSDGLAGWAIALIVVGVLLAVGGSVGAAVFFLVIKPKKSQKA